MTDPAARRRVAAGRLDGATALPEDSVALLVLDGLPGVGPRAVGRLVTAFGSAEGALASRRRDFESIAGPGAAAARRDGARRADARARLETAVQQGIDVLTWGSDAYPAGLFQLADPPPLLFLRGRAELLGRGGVAVVGSRRATADGRDAARRLGRSLGRAGVVTWSGLALGIDGAAHAGALEAGGDTVAVLGAGIDVPYPPRHRDLHARIQQEGLLVSEFPPGMSAAPWTFPRRNRVLAALTETTVVVEAGRRSGALITVDHALDLGRDVWAVPGPIDRAAHAGSNRMLADGARPLVSIPDFVSGVRSAPPRPAPVARRTAAEAPAQRSILEVGVLQALAGDPLVAEEVARVCGLDIPTTLALLTTLEIHGEIERLPGPRFRAAA